MIRNSLLIFLYSTLHCIVHSLESNRTPLYRKVRCFSCTSVNATAIVGGAGVDPGVFLSTIRLGSIPITRRCLDDFESEAAVRAGAATPVCEDGLCVKINYTDKLTGRTDVLRACLPESQGVFKRSCARFSSSQAGGTWCVCGNELCNSAPMPPSSWIDKTNLILLTVLFSLLSTIIISPPYSS